MSYVFNSGYALDCVGTRIADDVFLVERLDDGWHLKVAFPDLSDIQIDSVSDRDALDAATWYARNPAAQRGSLFRQARKMSLQGRDARQAVIVNIWFNSKMEFENIEIWQGHVTGVISGTYQDADTSGTHLHRDLAVAREFVDALQPQMAGRFNDSNCSSLLVNVLMRVVNIACCVVLVEHGISAALWRTMNYGHRVQDGMLSVFPVPHPGMDLAAYARFTSPLRRYEDVVNQRILIAAINHQPAPYDEDELQGLVTLLSAETLNIGPAPWSTPTGDDDIEGADMRAQHALRASEGDMPAQALDWFSSRIRHPAMLHFQMTGHILTAEGRRYEAARQMMAARMASCPAEARGAIVCVMGMGRLTDHTEENENGISGYASLSIGSGRWQTTPFQRKTLSIWRVEAARRLVGLIIGGAEPVPVEPYHAAAKQLLAVCFQRGLPAPVLDYELSRKPLMASCRVSIGSMATSVHGARNFALAEDMACTEILMALGYTSESDLDSVPSPPTLLDIASAAGVAVPNLNSLRPEDSHCYRTSLVMPVAKLADAKASVPTLDCEGWARTHSQSQLMARLLFLHALRESGLLEATVDIPRLSPAVEPDDEPEAIPDDMVALLDEAA